jgi:hypothetical protein
MAKAKGEKTMVYNGVYIADDEILMVKTVDERIIPEGEECFTKNGWLRRKYAKDYYESGELYLDIELKDGRKIKISAERHEKSVGEMLMNKGYMAKGLVLGIQERLEKRDASSNEACERGLHE